VNPSLQWQVAFAQYAFLGQVIVSQGKITAGGGTMPWSAISSFLQDDVINIEIRRNDKLLIAIDWIFCNMIIGLILNIKIRINRLMKLHNMQMKRWFLLNFAFSISLEH
jgi:hypothetical protein